LRKFSHKKKNSVYFLYKVAYSGLGDVSTVAAVVVQKLVNLHD